MISQMLFPRLAQYLPRAVLLGIVEEVIHHRVIYGLGCQYVVFILPKCSVDHSPVPQSGR